MAAAKSLSLLTHFRDMKDPRINRTRRHLLLDIIGLSICAVMAGAESWRDIERFGKANEAWIMTFLSLPHGIPSHDTTERQFRRLKPQEFQFCFANWTRALCAELGLKQVTLEMDLFSRRVAGWDLAEHMTEELVLDPCTRRSAADNPHPD